MIAQPPPVALRCCERFNRQRGFARRLALEPGPNNGFLASNPSTGVILVRDDQAGAN